MNYPSIDLQGIKNPTKVAELVIREEYKTILQTLDSIPEIVSVAGEMANRIQDGSKVFCIGCGASGLVAKEMAGQLTELGVRAIPFTNDFSEAQPISFSKGFAEKDFGLSMYVASMVMPGDVVVGFSISGRTGFVVGALKLARGRRALTVAVTLNKDSWICEFADFVIQSYGLPEGPTATKTQISQLAIVHAIDLLLADELAVNEKMCRRSMLEEEVSSKAMGDKGDEEIYRGTLFRGD